MMAVAYMAECCFNVHSTTRVVLNFWVTRCSPHLIPDPDQASILHAHRRYQKLAGAC